MKELESLNINSIEFNGAKKIFNLPVLGKGCVGLVVAASRNGQKIALKIRRVDADRKNMRHEAEMLRLANKLNIGPKLLGETENFLVMEFIEGYLISEWIAKLKGKSQKARIRRVIHEIMEQCWLMDNAGLDHGELSNASKHVIIDEAHHPVIIDYETASTSRKASNVTSICQYLFIGSKTAKIITKKLGEIDREKLLENLKKYKQQKTRENFENILKTCKIIVNPT
jgi:putative serine/threonine protein kinase